VLLAAPTGKAAKRLAEAAGHESVTVHRLLEYHPDRGCQRHRDHPVDGQLVIVDESSMLDIELMAALVEAIAPRRTRLLLVGDPLPAAVGRAGTGVAGLSGIGPDAHHDAHGGPPTGGPIRDRAARASDPSRALAESRRLALVGLSVGRGVSGRMRDDRGPPDP
jgi:hypothetical protein